LELSADCVSFPLSSLILEPYDKSLSERFGELLECLQTWPMPAAFEAADGCEAGSHSDGELMLGEGVPNSPGNDHSGNDLKWRKSISLRLVGRRPGSSSSGCRNDRAANGADVCLAACHVLPGWSPDRCR
jgi:hypothetical protein